MSKAKTPHKHAACIKAWADGDTVQFRGSPSAGWTDLNDAPQCAPSWYAHYEYRVKPDPVVIRYRVAACRLNNEWYMLVADSTDAGDMAAYTNFRYWITDWIEHEVKE